MRLALHTVICCCVFTTVLPLVKGATGELNTGLKKRFKVWLQSRMKRDLCDSVVAANQPHSDVNVGQQDKNAIVSSPSRPRRSMSTRSSGCLLVTCLYQDLIHQLHQINNKQKEAKAPGIKIGSKGYGRRRRSLPDVTRPALKKGRQRCSTEAASKVSLAAEV